MGVPLAWIVPRGLQADEPEWWYGRLEVEAAPERTPAPKAAGKAKGKRPAPAAATAGTAVENGVAPKAAPQLDLFNLAGLAGRLGLPNDVMARLGDDEKTALVLLRENGTARSSELAQRLHKNPLRLNGLMARLRRTLDAAGTPRFRTETLPSGETLYRYDEADAPQGE